MKVAYSKVLNVNTIFSGAKHRKLYCEIRSKSKFSKFKNTKRDSSLRFAPFRMTAGEIAGEQK
jgi:hypothetical protein